MKVAILTMFNGLSNTYSLVNVVAEHLKMLLSAGIPTKVVVRRIAPIAREQAFLQMKDWNGLR